MATSKKGHSRQSGVHRRRSRYAIFRARSGALFNTLMRRVSSLSHSNRTFSDEESSSPAQDSERAETGSEDSIRQESDYAEYAYPIFASEWEPNRRIVENPSTSQRPTPPPLRRARSASKADEISRMRGVKTPSSHQLSMTSKADEVLRMRGAKTPSKYQLSMTITSQEEPRPPVEVTDAIATDGLLLARQVDCHAVPTRTNMTTQKHRAVAATQSADVTVHGTGSQPPSLPQTAISIQQAWLREACCEPETAQQNLRVMGPTPSRAKLPRPLSSPCCAGTPGCATGMRCVLCVMAKTSRVPADCGADVRVSLSPTHAGLESPALPITVNGASMELPVPPAFPSPSGNEGAPPGDANEASGNDVPDGHVVTSEDEAVSDQVGATSMGTVTDVPPAVDTTALAVTDTIRRFEHMSTRRVMLLPTGRDGTEAKAERSAQDTKKAGWTLSNTRYGGASSHMTVQEDYQAWVELAILLTAALCTVYILYHAYSSGATRSEEHSHRGRRSPDFLATERTAVAPSLLARKVTGAVARTRRMIAHNRRALLAAAAPVLTLPQLQRTVLHATMAVISILRPGSALPSTAGRVIISSAMKRAPRRYVERVLAGAAGGAVSWMATVAAGASRAAVLPSTTTSLSRLTPGWAVEVLAAAKHGAGTAAATLATPAAKAKVA